MILQQICNLTKDSQPIVILSGDFNAIENERSIKILIENRNINLFSASQNDNNGTFHEFTGEAEDKIDYIFHNDSVSCDYYQVIEDSNNGKYPSDHFPIIAELNIKKGYKLNY